MNVYTYPQPGESQFTRQQTEQSRAAHVSLDRQNQLERAKINAQQELADFKQRMDGMVQAASQRFDTWRTGQSDQVAAQGQELQMNTWRNDNPNVYQYSGMTPTAPAASAFAGGGQVAAYGPGGVTGPSIGGRPSPQITSGPPAPYSPGTNTYRMGNYMVVQYAGGRHAVFDSSGARVLGDYLDGDPSSPVSAGGQAGAAAGQSIQAGMQAAAPGAPAAAPISGAAPGSTAFPGGPSLTTGSPPPVPQSTPASVGTVTQSNGNVVTPRGNGSPYNPLSDPGNPGAATGNWEDWVFNTGSRQWERTTPQGAGGGANAGGTGGAPTPPASTAFSTEFEEARKKREADLKAAKDAEDRSTSQQEAIRSSRGEGTPHTSPYKRGGQTPPRRGGPPMRGGGPAMPAGIPTKVVKQPSGPPAGPRQMPTPPARTALGAPAGANALVGDGKTKGGRANQELMIGPRAIATGDVKQVSSPKFVQAAGGTLVEPVRENPALRATNQRVLPEVPGVPARMSGPKGKRK